MSNKLNIVEQDNLSDTEEIDLTGMGYSVEEIDMTKMNHLTKEVELEDKKVDLEEEVVRNFVHGETHFENQLPTNNDIEEVQGAYWNSRNRNFNNVDYNVGWQLRLLGTSQPKKIHTEPYHYATYKVCTVWVLSNASMPAASF
jgi:hypothetical protein